MDDAYENEERDTDISREDLDKLRKNFTFFVRNFRTIERGIKDGCHAVGIEIISLPGKIYVFVLNHVHHVENHSF